MTANTDWAKKANAALATMKTKPRKRPPKKQNPTEGENINPEDVETRFGSLVPWGGAMLGGASIRFEDEGEEE